jgi:anti-sigma regulatory factor (Ser/Thr protein kinase)
MRATRRRDTAAFAHQVWPARAGALSLIRREVRRWLGPLEVTPETEADLVLAVSEAASNVIDHAYRTPTDGATVEVFLWTESGALLVEVVDHGQWRHPGPHAIGRGRGIEVMRCLVDAVLIHHDTRGTRVLLRHLTSRSRPVGFQTPAAARDHRFQVAGPRLIRPPRLASASGRSGLRSRSAPSSGLGNHDR